MVEWEKPHWSGRPQLAPDTRPRLRPNFFARLARFCMRRSALVLITLIFLCAAAIAFAAATLDVDPGAAPKIELDAQTSAAQQSLESNFPGIDSTFVATIDLEDPAAARATALSLAVTLSKRSDLFTRAFVPGAGPYYAKYAILFRDADDIEAKVNNTLQLQPLYEALARSPNLSGLAALITAIDKSVAQGRSPPGLARLLSSISASVESEVTGVAQPVRWSELAGLSAELESKRWFVIATPVSGKEQEAAGYGASLVKNTQGVSWSQPQQTSPGSYNLLVDFAIPAVAAALIVLVVLGVGLGSVRHVTSVIVAAAATLCVSSAVASALAGRLDGVTWSFAFACLAPAFLFSIIFVLGEIQSRSRGSPPETAIMLAAQRRGLLLVALAAMIACMWMVWLFRQLPSLGQLAEIAVAGTVIALIVTFTAVPALLKLLDRGEPGDIHWLDVAVASPLGSNLRNTLQMLVLLLFGAGIFCAVLIPGLRFGDVAAQNLPATELDTPEARGAIHLLAKDNSETERLVAAATRLEQTGAIRTIEQFLPLEPDRKLQSLKRLEGFLPGLPAESSQAGEASLAETFATLSAGLKQIAAEGATAPDLRDAAHRLRRAFGLFTNPELPPLNRIHALEGQLFSGLAQLSGQAEQLSRLQKPGLADLDQGLRERFLSRTGVTRIEVLPKPGVGRLSFAAAMRKLDPLAAGAPLVELARNEIIHHEAAYAIAAALVAAALVLLVLLRNPLDWIMLLVPAGLAISLSAAAVVGSGQSLSPAMLGAAMTSLALCLSSSLIMVLRTKPPNSRSPSDTSFRAALLPPLAVLGAIAPLLMSGTVAVAATAFASILFLCIATTVIMIVVPQLAHWLAPLRRSKHGQGMASQVDGNQPAEH